MATKTAAEAVQSIPVILTNISGNNAQSRGMGVLSQLKSLGYGIFETEPGHDDKPTVWGLLSSSKPEERKAGAALIEDHEPHICRLAQGILARGQLQPIALFMTKDKKYNVIFGMRRALACLYNFAKNEKNGCTVLARIFDKMDDINLKLMALEENDNRDDESPIDKAMTYQWLKKEGGLENKKIAEKVGQSEQNIAAYLRLLSPHLADKRMAIHLGDMSIDKALTLLKKRKNEGSGAEVDTPEDTAAGSRARFPSVKSILRIYDATKKPKKMDDKEWSLWTTEDVRKLISKLLKVKFKPFKAAKAEPEDDASDNGDSTKGGKDVRKILKVKRERIVKLLISLGKTNARTWKDDAIAEHANDIGKLCEPDQKVEDESLQKLLDKLLSGTYSVKLEASK